MSQEAMALETESYYVLVNQLFNLDESNSENKLKYFAEFTTVVSGIKKNKYSNLSPIKPENLADLEKEFSESHGITYN